MANVNKKTTNSFSKGLIMDFSPEKTGNEVLTHALNATLLTFNGNEMSLLNDMGNARVETAFLPEGYVPVGSCEFGDIIYVVSYNPLIDKALIGCFPSPERNISSEELGLNPVTISSSEFLEIENNKPTGNIKTSSVKKIIFSNDMHPGDLYVIYQESLDALSKSPISDYGNSDHEISKFPKLVKINVVSIEDSGKINYLNSSVKWYDNDYFILDSFDTQGVKKDIDSYRTITNSAYATFASKVSGKLALLIELEKITGFSCTWECFLPKSLEYTPWVYTGYDKIEALQPNISDLNVDNLWINHKSDDENVVNVIYTNTTCQLGDSLYEIDYPYSFKGVVPDKGILGSINKLYRVNQTYTLETNETLRIIPSRTFRKKYDTGDTIIINSDEVKIETPFVWVEDSVNGLVYLCAMDANMQVPGTSLVTGDSLTCRVYIPINTPIKTPIPSNEATELLLDTIFNDFITKHYKIYSNTKYTFEDKSYNINGSLQDSNGVYVVYGYYEGQTHLGYTSAIPKPIPEINFKKENFKTYPYSFIEFNNRLYVNTEYILTLDSISKLQIEDNNYLLFRHTPIYMNFNWTTDDKNINPKYALLEKSEWSKNYGEFKIYKVNGSNINTQSKYINEYNKITTYNTTSGSGKFWNFSRIYHPEDNISYSDFKNTYNYDTFVTKFINETLLRDSQQKKVFSSIKNIIRSVDGLLNKPNENYYYINACNYYSNTVNGFKEYYEALLDVNGDVVLEIPKKIQITHQNIKDDIINNTFKYPVLKKFEDFKIPIQLEINGEIINLDQSNFVYNYEVTPAMPYGKLDELKISGSIDFSKIGLTDINITKWKYYNTDTHLTLTWGMDAYTEPGKGISEIIFEFYDNQGLAAAYHVSNYSSFNGLFTNYLTLNQNQGTPGLNNLNWKGEEFFHMKKAIPRELASNDTTYYYLSDTTYTKINNLEELPENITTLYESDAGTLYSNWLYGVKVIVRYEYKNALGNYIHNDNPFIFYRWLWTNSLFNKHYYTIDDFNNLLFSLNLDMNVDYSTTEDWYLLQEDYCNPEVTNDPSLSGDSLLGATIQYINCDRTKNNVKLKVTPGLLETYNTFTLCSEKQDHNNTTIYPLKEIFAEVILADQTLNNYPELPNGKQYSYGIQESEYTKLTPYSASILTGSPLSEDGKLYGKILGSKVGIPSDENDLFSGASTEYFKNNFSLYNESYINYERFKDKDDNYEDINLSTSLDFSDYSIAISSFSSFAVDGPVIMQPSQSVEVELIGDVGGKIHTTLQTTLYRYISIKTGTTVNDLNEILNKAIENIDIDLDLSKSEISAEENGHIYNFYKSSSKAYDEIASEGGTIYKLGRTYKHNTSTGVKSGSSTYDVPAEFYETVTAYVDVLEGTVTTDVNNYEFMYIQSDGVNDYGHICTSEGSKKEYEFSKNNLLLNTLFISGSDTSTNMQVPNWNCKFKNYYTTQGESVTKAYPLYNNEKNSVMYCEYINKGMVESGLSTDSNYGDVLYLLLTLNENQWYTLSYSVIAEVINNQGEVINIPDDWYEETSKIKGLTIASYIYPSVAATTSDAYMGSNESGTYVNNKSTISSDCAHISKLPINGWVDYTTTFKTIDNLDNSDNHGKGKSVLFRIIGPTKDTDYYDEVYKIRILITNISLICHGEVETNITLFPERQIEIGETDAKYIENYPNIFNSYYKINTTISSTDIYNVNTNNMTYTNGLYTFKATDRTPAKTVTYNPIKASYTEGENNAITLYLSMCDKISPKYFLDNGISKFITKGNKYVIECDLSDVSVYFAYRDDFGSLFGEKDYLSLNCYKYYINKSHIESDFEENCLNKLNIININNGTGSFEAPHTGDVIFIVNSTEPCNLSVYKETESFKLQPLEYYDSNGILKSVDNYYSYLFESDKHNLYELMNSGLDLALSGIHFSKYLLSTEEAEVENNIVRPYVYFEEDLKYNNLCINDGYPGFKYILFFSMDNVSGENSKLMTSFHEIAEYKSKSYSSDISIEAPINTNYYNSGSDGNISYTKLNDKKEWMNNQYCLFYPVGWGTLRDEDGSRYTSFKRGNTSVSLQGVAGKRSSISGTTTLGIVTYNSNNEPQYVLFADDWRSKGIRDHAGDVMNFLTQTYFLTDDVIKVKYGKIKNYAYLYDNYCVYTRDILVKLHTNSSNQNNMITLRGLDFLQYVDVVKLNMNSTNLNDSNVTVNLDSVMKVVPIGFKFNYIMPLVKLGGDAPDKGYCVFKVTNPSTKPYDIIYGLSISKNYPYCLSGLIFTPLSSISLIDNIKNLKFKSNAGNQLDNTDNTKYNNPRIQAYTIDNEKGLPNGKMLIHSLNKNVKHYSNTVNEHTVNEHTYYKLLPTGVRSASKSWELLSTKNVGMWGNTKDYLYITDLPCDTTKENNFKYFD